MGQLPTTAHLQPTAGAAGEAPTLTALPPKAGGSRRLPTVPTPGVSRLVPRRLRAAVAVLLPPLPPLLPAPLRRAPGMLAPCHTPLDGGRSAPRPRALRRHRLPPLPGRKPRLLPSLLTSPPLASPRLGEPPEGPASPSNPFQQRRALRLRSVASPPRPRAKWATASPCLGAGSHPSFPSGARWRRGLGLTV